MWVSEPTESPANRPAAVTSARGPVTDRAVQTHAELIWAKTYPELTSKYIETVCTAGLLPSAKPLRLYPIPYRYLRDEKEQFKLYQASS